MLVGLDVEKGRVRGVHTSRGAIRAEVVAVCCGIWSPRIARMAGAAGVLGMQTELQPVAEDILRVMRRIHGGRGLRLELRAEGRPVFKGERQDCEELLGNLLDNACKWARTRVSIAARADSDRVLLTVDDDGPGPHTATVTKTIYDAAPGPCRRTLA